MKLNCFACGKETKMGELCNEHSQELKKVLDDKKGVIENPAFAHHCMICGEYEGKLILEQPSSGIYFCGDCIEENWKNQG